MSEQNKTTPKTVVTIKPTKPVETGTEKPLDVPARIGHPRKDKARLGKFGIAEGGKTFPKKPKE